MKTAQVALVAAGGSVTYQYTTGGCALCAVVGIGADSGSQLVRTSAQPERPAKADEFQQVRRPAHG